MHWKEWLLAVGYSFNPLHYKKVCDAPFPEMFLLVTRTILVSFLLMLMLAAPSLFSIPGELSDVLTYFDVLDIRGRAQLNTAIGFPQHDPQLVIDLSQKKVYEGERMLLTESYFYFRTPLKPQKVSLEYVKDPLAHPKEAGLIIFVLFLLWLPSLLIYGYIVTFLKYLLWIIIASVIAFIIIRAVVLSSMRLHRIVNLCAYSLLPIIILEIILIPFDTGFLLPILDFLGFSINVGTIVIYLVLLSIGLITLEKEIRIEVKDRR